MDGCYPQPGLLQARLASRSIRRNHVTGASVVARIAPTLECSASAEPGTAAYAPKLVVEEEGGASSARRGPQQWKAEVADTETASGGTMEVGRLAHAARVVCCSTRKPTTPNISEFLLGEDACVVGERAGGGRPGAPGAPQWVDDAVRERRSPNAAGVACRPGLPSSAARQLPLPMLVQVEYAQGVSRASTPSTELATAPRPKPYDALPLYDRPHSRFGRRSRRVCDRGDPLRCA